MPPRLLIALLPLLLAACSDLSHLKKEALAGTPTPRLLTPTETDALARAWRKAGFASQIDGYSIDLKNEHPSLPTITKLIRGNEIRTRLPKQDNSIGIPALVGSGPPHRISVPLTPTAHQLTLHQTTLIARQLSPDQLQIELRDPRLHPSRNGKALARADQLLFDFIQREQEDKLVNLRGLLSPSKYANRRGFYLSTPYDRNKIPVIFIHGLASSPFTFRDMVIHLQRDPDLWRRYQFWFYLYPTGDPWLATAANFRRDLRDLVGNIDPNHNDRHLRNMVVVAHSMGGLITRASISHNSKALYDAYFNRDLHQLGLTSREKSQLQSLLLYDPLPWPKRVVFLSTPHQGSRLATGPLEWVARNTISLPGRLIGGTFHTLEHLISRDPGVLTEEAHPFFENGEVSVSQLDADNPALLALENMPIRKDVHLHSIIGDLGGNSLPLRTDGVVPYESAHLPQADSEIVVRSSHGTGGNGAAAVEVARILRLHR